MPARLSNGRLRLRNGRIALAGAGAVTPVDPPVDPPASSVVLTLTDIDKDQRVFQRVGTSKQVPVSVTYSGGTPTAIEARVVDSTTGTAASAWQVIDPAPTNGAASGLLNVPQGGWYNLEVRAAGGTSVRGAKKFGVGILIGLIGQSNMVNFAGTAYDYPLGDKRSVEYRNGLFQRVGNINDAFAPNTRYGSVGNGYGSFSTAGRRGDGYTYLANLVSQGMNLPVCLVEKAAGGTSINKWVPNGASWTAFAGLLAESGGDCEVALWMQGEDDAGTMLPDTMIGKLGELLGQLHAATGRNSSNFHFGVISLSVGSSYAGATPGEWGAMRDAQARFGNNTAGAFFVTAAHDAHAASDGLHIGGEAFFRLGRRYAKSVLARFGVGATCAGARAVSAAWDGSGVVLTVQHTGGTALLDGTGGTGTALTGFEFKDAGGTVMPYTTSAITSATTLRFALAAKPATVSYAMMDVPHAIDAKTEPVWASIPYDNATYLDGHSVPFGLSLVGAPLQPFAAIAVTGA